MDEQIEKVKQRIEELRRKQAVQPNFGVQKSKHKSMKFSDEEEAEFQEWRKRRGDQR